MRAEETERSTGHRFSSLPISPLLSNLWNARKVLRRFADRERLHTAYIEKALIEVEGHPYRPSTSFKKTQGRVNN